MRLIAVALVGTTAVQLGAGNGAAVGLWALTAAFATEAAVLLYRVRNMRKAGTLRPQLGRERTYTRLHSGETL